MYFFKKPGQEEIQKAIDLKRNAPFSYVEVGRSRQLPPEGYVIDHNRTRLGFGAQAFEQARAALGRWEMFRLGWLQLCWPNAPLRVGSTVGVLVRVFGWWSLNMCRIVYLLEEDGDIARFGFAYGTLPDHAECGEERFSVEWHRADDSVWYDLLAFSRPNHFLSRLGYLYARRLQKRFAVGSMAAMRRAVDSRVMGNW